MRRHAGRFRTSTRRVVPKIEIKNARHGGRPDFPCSGRGSAGSPEPARIATAGAHVKCLDATAAPVSGAGENRESGQTISNRYVLLALQPADNGVTVRHVEV